ncbi:DUF5683 domain-containing protein [Echinicola jeungdonensis]|uniref:DUF5683 domain-containing protein n=1 Tax=Echinicola jeungdonensis TaxID=709343 RepID=A0ABV5J931_9BACT|nr:DUF5683 domain-containing protein [Echinicola jeungdonensis]MDN3670154.1 DUF5683 domain-containing protein [Echinicola jeungdonensis]
MAIVYFSKTIAVFVLLLLLHHGVSGQEIIDLDTAAQESEIILNKNPKNPRTAVILSAILPGAGQIYNEKPWKVPLLYGGIATNLYFLDFNNRRYQLFKRALEVFREDDPNVPNMFPYLNEAGLIRNVDYWRRNRDGVYLLFGAIYVLNIIDALVDAHLSGFDVSDDLTMNIEPALETMSARGKTIGLSFKLKF